MSQLLRQGLFNSPVTTSAAAAHSLPPNPPLSRLPSPPALFVPAPHGAQVATSGGKPVSEHKEFGASVADARPAAGVEGQSDSLLLLAARDNAVKLWDYKTGCSSTTFRLPGFALGTFGSMGRGRCHCEVSPDGGLVAVGAADGAVYVADVQVSPGLGNKERNGRIRTQIDSELRTLEREKRGGKHAMSWVLHVLHAAVVVRRGGWLCAFLQPS